MICIGAKTTEGTHPINITKDHPYYTIVISIFTKRIPISFFNICNSDIEFIIGKFRRNSFTWSDPFLYWYFPADLSCLIEARRVLFAIFMFALLFTQSSLFFMYNFCSHLTYWPLDVYDELFRLIQTHTKWWSMSRELVFRIFCRQAKDVDVPCVGEIRLHLLKEHPR